MRVVLQDGAREVTLVSRDQFIEFSSEPSAFAFLRHLMTDPVNWMAIQQVWLDEWPSVNGRIVDDRAILTHLAERLARGDIQVISGPNIYGQQAVNPPPEPDARESTPREDELAAKEDRPAPEPEEDTTWIEIELLDDEGNPIPNEQYAIEIPGGSVRVGRLDDNGYARVEGLDPNTCKVSFPNLDKSSYDRQS